MSEKESEASASGGSTSASGSSGSGLTKFYQMNKKRLTSEDITEMVKLLCQSIKKDDLRVMKHLASNLPKKARSEWEGPKTSESAPLHVAAGYGKVDAVKILIDLGFDKNAVFNGGSKWKNVTPLHWAIHQSQLDVVKFLVKSSARMDISADCSYFKGTVLEMVEPYGKHNRYKIVIQGSISKEGSAPPEGANSKSTKPSDPFVNAKSKTETPKLKDVFSQHDPSAHLKASPQRQQEILSRKFSELKLAQEQLKELKQPMAGNPNLILQQKAIATGEYIRQFLNACSQASDSVDLDYLSSLEEELASVSVIESASVSASEASHVRNPASLSASEASHVINPASFPASEASNFRNPDPFNLKGYPFSKSERLNSEISKIDQPSAQMADPGMMQQVQEALRKSEKALQLAMKLHSSAPTLKDDLEKPPEGSNYVLDNFLQKFQDHKVTSESPLLGASEFSIENSLPKTAFGLGQKEMIQSSAFSSGTTDEFLKALKVKFESEVESMRRALVAGRDISDAIRIKEEEIQRLQNLDGYRTEDEMEDLQESMIKLQNKICKVQILLKPGTSSELQESLNCMICLEVPVVSEENMILSCGKCDALMCSLCKPLVKECTDCKTAFSDIEPKRNKWAEKFLRLNS